MNAKVVAWYAVAMAMFVLLCVIVLALSLDRRLDRLERETGIVTTTAPRPARTLVDR